MAQRVGAFRVFRVAHQTVRPFIHLTHGGAFSVKRICKAIKRLKLMIVSGLELKMLAGVILRRFKRLGENLQRQGIRIVGEARELHLLLGMLL